jgi:hypothetical protein
MGKIFVGISCRSEGKTLTSPQTKFDALFERENIKDKVAEASLHVVAERLDI